MVEGVVVVIELLQLAVDVHGRHAANGGYYAIGAVQNENHPVEARDGQVVIELTAAIPVELRDVARERPNGLIIDLRCPQVDAAQKLATEREPFQSVVATIADQ